MAVSDISVVAHSMGELLTRSALGEHSDPRRELGFAKSEQLICYRMNHMEPLSSPLLAQQMLDRLKPGKANKSIKA